ncbi:MAG: glycosyltransferase [Synergistaceae bacterium]|nr:glycosyltransferase [Synergistaceae bacterium]
MTQPDNSAMISPQRDSCPLISVIVPVYNTEKYLAQCVNSILTQTYANLELILVDDGSTDSSPAMCDDFARKDSRVRVIHKENGGAGLARNAGLDAANGELVATVDSDDCIMPEMYARLYALMSENGADMAMCGYVLDDGSGNVGGNAGDCRKPEVITGEESLYRLVMPGWSVEYIYLWNKLYRSELFRGVRFPPGNRHDDTARMHRLSGSCGKIVITQEKLYVHRSVQDSVMGRIGRDSFDAAVHMKHFADQSEAFRDREEYLRSRGMNDLAEFSHLRSSAYGVMALMLQKLNCLQYRKEIRDITGYSPLRLALRLLTSGHSQLRKRGVKLFALWMRSLFRPFKK